MKNLFISIGVVALLSAGALGYFLWPRESTDTKDHSSALSFSLPTPSAPPLSQPAAVPLAVGADNVYTNTTYQFALQVPEGLSATSYDEGGGAATLTFENTDAGQGFQIFIVPFIGTQISEERFRQDNPSGMRENVRQATVGGASGAAFYSSSPTLGDTYEVWFVKNGYLYEVTTFRILEPWLNQILSTWRFI